MHIDTLIPADIQRIYWEDKTENKMIILKMILLRNLINFKIDRELEKIANIKMKYKIWWESVLLRNI